MTDCVMSLKNKSNGTNKTRTQDKQENDMVDHVRQVDPIVQMFKTSHYIDRVISKNVAVQLDAISVIGLFTCNASVMGSFFFLFL